MTLEYVYALTDADYYRYGPTVTDYWAKIPARVRLKDNITATNANRYVMTFYWYEFYSGSNYERHEYSLETSVPLGTQTTGEKIFGIPLDSFTNPNKVCTYPEPYITVEWYAGTGSGELISRSTYTFRIYGKDAAVDWTYNVPNPYSTQYPLVNQPFYMPTILSDYNSTSSGAPFVWRNAHGGIPANEWSMGVIDVGGSIVPFYNASSYLSQASSYSYVTDKTSLKINGYFINNLSASGITRPGRYRIGVMYYDQAPTDIGGNYNTRYEWSDYFTVYSPFEGAAFHISSIVPSEYQEGSADPLRGKYPFTVTVVDDTYSRRGTYVVPLKSITIDWDDPQSESGSWTISNPGSSVITIPPHVYNDGNAHNIQMICTDYLDNVTTERVTFAPSKEPRIIHPPTVTYDGTEAPVLVTGTIDVAGVPLPEITWTYALRNGDPEYYAGEKKGEYTEFSLLAGGTYDITCKAMNGEVTLGFWDDWHPTITEPTPTPDTPVSANNFDIWVYQNGQRVDVIKPTRCQYVDRLAHSSYCEFELPMNYRNISLLMPGAEIAVGYLGKARYMMVTEFSEDSLGEYCSVTAMDAATVALQNRIATVATHSLSDGGYDVQTCSAERLLRYFAVSNIRSGNRVVPRFRVVGTNQDRGGKITYSARYEPILTIMEEICTQSGLGWDSSLQSDSSVIFSFKVIGGTDHTAGTTNPIIFTERENGLRSAQVSAYHGMLGSNLVIAAGKGEGDTRVQYQDYGATTVSDIQRREVFLDASDSATDYEVQCAAETELARQDEQTITIYPNEQVYKFGVDYNLGDYVTVITKSGMQLNLQIHQANMSLDDTGVNLSLECGTDIRDYQRLIQRNKFENTYARK